VQIICLDVEGVLVPEIWINVAERSGIEELSATTRDIPDYNELMQFRLELVRKHKLRLPDIQAVIDTLSPLPGAQDFLLQLRSDYQVVLLSDTFEQFARPLMRQLGWPAILCHELVIGEDGTIDNYRLRQQDQKREAVRAFHSLNLHVIAAGDSYNDTSMLAEADAGILFCPPDNVIREFPQYPVTRDYPALRKEIDSAIGSL
jgi:phosphoserine/homoserine phosphotransferase